MKTFRMAAIAAVVLIAFAGAALAVSSIRVIANGQPHGVRAIQVGGAWYVNASDLANALGNGASFDASTHTLLASTSDRNSLLHTVDRAGGGFASDGTVA